MARVTKVVAHPMTRLGLDSWKLKQPGLEVLEVSFVLFILVRVWAVVFLILFLEVVMLSLSQSGLSFAMWGRVGDCGPVCCVFEGVASKQLQGSGPSGPAFRCSGVSNFKGRVWRVLFAAIVAGARLLLLPWDTRALKGVPSRLFQIQFLKLGGLCW